MIELSEGLRPGGSIDTLGEGATSTGDSVIPSTKLGVDEQDRPVVATLPKRKGGSGCSELCGRCGM